MAVRAAHRPLAAADAAGRLHAATARLPHPAFALTVLIGAGLWPLDASGPPDAASDLPTLTLRMLSAPTVPQVLLDRLAGRQHRRP